MPIERVILSINVRWWNAEAAYAVSLARGLVEEGVAVWLIVNPQSPVHHKAISYGLPVITDILLDSQSPLVQWKNLRRLLDHIDKKQIQLVNSFKSNGAILFTIARRIRPEIVYIKTRGIASPPKNHFINRYLYGTRSCDGVITVGSPVNFWMQALLGQQSDQQITTIYYGDTPVCEDIEQQLSKSVSRFSIPENHTVFALLGRTQKVKGHLLLLDALAELKNLSLHLLFLVKDLDEFPEVLSEIQDFISEHQLQERVTILGFQENLEDVLAIVDCGVIPSLASEVNCRVCVEFFSMGIPVISFPTGTLPDIVMHKKNGYLCSAMTVSELVDGMKWFMDNPGEVAAAKLHALADYRKNFTLQKMAQDTLEFYQQCKSD